MKKSNVKTEQYKGLEILSYPDEKTRGKCYFPRGSVKKTFTNGNIAEWHFSDIFVFIPEEDRDCKTKTKAHTVLIDAAKQMIDNLLIN